MWLDFFKRLKGFLSTRPIFVGLLSAFLVILWPLSSSVYNDLRMSILDPKIPFQIYKLPEKPDYYAPKAWLINSGLRNDTPDVRKVDMFFVAGTAYNGGKDWLSPVNNQAVREELNLRQLPNYAGPFSVSGDIYAPLYRHASLYAHQTMREDAQEARKASYEDIRVSFDHFLKNRKRTNGFVLIGVEQGAFLIERLLMEPKYQTEEFRKNIIAIYLIEAMIPQAYANKQNLPICLKRGQIGCVFAYKTLDEARAESLIEDRRLSLYWLNETSVASVGVEPVICVNPIMGGVSEKSSTLNDAKGATNATGIEWDNEPALMRRKITARCDKGHLVVNKKNIHTLKRPQKWEDQRKIPAYSLFYGDLRDDVHERISAYLALQNQE